MALLSRVAEGLYWLGRYVERAENTARLLDVTYHGRLEPSTHSVVGATNTWEALVATLGLQTEYEAAKGEVSEQGVLEFLTLDRSTSSSIGSAIATARENARSARDFLSSETWVAINRLYRTTAERNLHLIMADGVYDFCDLVRQGAGLFHGTHQSTSLHDEGYAWLRAGVQIERADMITRLVDSKYHLLMPSLDEVGGPLDRYQWTALLRSVSGYEAFRRTHVAGVEAHGVVRFLLLNEQFPRSLRAAVDELGRYLTLATDGAESRLRNPVMRQVADLQNGLRFETAESLIGYGLHEWLGSAQGALGGLNGTISAAFFWSASSAA